MIIIVKKTLKSSILHTSLLSIKCAWTYGGHFGCSEKSSSLHSSQSNYISIESPGCPLHSTAGIDRVDQKIQRTFMKTYGPLQWTQFNGRGLSR